MSITNLYNAAALFLYEQTEDPLLLDAIRSMTDRSTPPNVADTVRNYVKTTFQAYLTLAYNGAIKLPYGLRTDHFTTD